MTYEQLLAEAENNELTVKEKPLPISKGRIKGNRIAIRKDMTETEKACVLAEELGHHYTATGNILDQSIVESRKLELRGRLWAYNQLIGLRGIISCYTAGCRNSYEMAEYLGVTDEFICEALECYRRKYGMYTTCDNYVVHFEPQLLVLELV